MLRHKVFGLAMAALLALPLTLNASAVAAPPAGGAYGPATGAQVASERAQATTALQNPPVMLIENAGQFDDHARFQARGDGRTIWLSEDAIWVTVLDETEEQESTGARERTGSPLYLRTPAPQLRRGVHLKLSFVGANPHPHMESFNRLDTTVSYFIGNDPDQWHPDVPVWGGMRYVDPYPGVDLEITGEAGRWTWRLVCRANCQSALRAVRLRVEGADTLTLESLSSPAGGRGAGGEGLRLTTAVGDFTLPLLQAVSPDGTPLDLTGARPEVNGTEVTSPFSSSPPLSLPVSSQLATSSPQSSDLLYATFLGGSGRDNVYAIAVDGSGNAYVTGGTYSSDFPTTPGAFDTAYNGGDVFVAKPNPAGSGLAYATFLGGSNRDESWGIAIDGSDNAYVAGDTASSDFSTTPGAFDTTYNGNSDVFVAKLNPAGSGLAYATFLGGSGQDYSYGFNGGIAVDGSGNAYVAGDTASSNFPTTPGAFDTTYNGYNDVFVAKLNPAGSGLAYATFLGGTASDYGWGIAIDGSGNAYVAGYTYSSDFPTTSGAFDTTYNGNEDVFVAKLNPAGSGLTYATFLGGTASDYGYGGIAVDGSGNGYVTGCTGSSDFPTTPGAFDRASNGDWDVFVAKFNSAGSGLAYATFLGGSATDSSLGIAVDGSGNAYLTGYSRSSDFPTTPSAFDMTYNGNEDVFVAKFNSAGSGLAYATFLGGSGDDDGWAIAVDGSGNAYVAGHTYSSDFPTTPSAFDTSYNGGEDVFVAKLAMGPSPSGVVAHARLDIGMPYNTNRGCSSPYVGCGGPYHGFYNGVCTDLAMDAYSAGVPFNIQNALYQDHRTQPGRYRYGTARNAEDMRRYFNYNQQLFPHSQPYQPGDIAFFDWSGDGLTNHVNVISEVDANGRPLKMVDATGVYAGNPGGRALEHSWNSYYDQHVQAHGRLSGGLATFLPSSAATETLQVLYIAVDSPSVTLRLQDANGKSTSETYDENLVASNIESFIPYIPGGAYADLGTGKVISVTQPLSDTVLYLVELTGEASAQYHLSVQTLQDGAVTASAYFTESITLGETQGITLQLSAPGGVITFTASTPTPMPKVSVTPGEIEMTGLPGMLAQATITVTEAGGQQALNGVSVSVSDVMNQNGQVVTGALFAATPINFSVPAGGSQSVQLEIDLTAIQPGIYQGNVLITSANGGNRSIPLSVVVRPFEVFLPVVLKSGE